VALSNIDSRQASNEQHRFKNPFARIRLFQNLIPQLHFGDFFNTIDPKRTLTAVPSGDSLEGAGDQGKTVVTLTILLSVE
jgi:hypothetical protein